jgi:hypothetical protein
MGKKDKQSLEQVLGPEILDLARKITVHENAIPKVISVELKATPRGEVCSTQYFPPKLTLPREYIQYAGTQRTYAFGAGIGLMLQHKFNPRIRRFMEDAVGDENACRFFATLASRYVSLALLQSKHSPREAFEYAEQLRTDTAGVPDSQDSDITAFGEWYASRVFLKHGNRKVEELCALYSIDQVHQLVNPMNVKFTIKAKSWDER